MKSTNSRGNVEVYMPRDKSAALNKLADLSAVAAAREWERAALVALMVKPGKGGRPRKNVTKVRDVSGQQESISEFTRHGVYGFRSQDAVRAYLKAWEIGGLPVPEYGQKAELPNGEFPDHETLYGRLADKEEDSIEKPQDTTGETQDATEDDGVYDEAEEEDEHTREHPSPRPMPRPTPHAKEHVWSPDKWLKALDSQDPEQVITEGEPERIILLLKTMESWVESLRQAVDDAIRESAGNEH